MIGQWATLALAWGVILFAGWIVCAVADWLERRDEQRGNGQRTPTDPWEWTWYD